MPTGAGAAGAGADRAAGPVIGRACTTNISRPARAHSTSTGAPNSSSMRRPVRARSLASAGLRTAARRRSPGVSWSRVPVVAGTVMTSLPPTR